MLWVGVGAPQHALSHVSSRRDSARSGGLDGLGINAFARSRGSTMPGQMYGVMVSSGQRPVDNRTSDGRRALLDRGARSTRRLDPLGCLIAGPHLSRLSSSNLDGARIKEKSTSRMAEIARFIPANSGFDPDVIRILRAAYDRATSELHDGGHARVVRAIIASELSPWPQKASATPSACATPRW